MNYKQIPNLKVRHIAVVIIHLSVSSPPVQIRTTEKVFGKGCCLQKGQFPFVEEKNDAWHLSYTPYNCLA